MYSLVVQYCPAKSTVALSSPTHDDLNRVLTELGCKRFKSKKSRCMCESDKVSGTHCEIECNGHGFLDTSGGEYGGQEAVGWV